MQSFDVAIIGAGAGGLSVASLLDKQGKSVALIDPDKPGGECAYYGCVPSKVLLHAAETLTVVRKAHEVGLPKLEARFSFPELMAYKDRTVGDMTEQGSWEPWRDRQNITVFNHMARFVDSHTLQVNADTLHADNVVIATGTRSLVPPIDGIDMVRPLDHARLIGYNTGLTEQPRHLAIVGAGPIGVEMGQFFSRIGTRVTVIEQFDHILVREDPEMADLLQDCLEEDGIEFRLGFRVSQMAKRGDETVLTGDDGAEVVVDQVMVAAGMRPVTDTMALENAGVETGHEGYIVVNARMQTSVPHIYAVGDVAGNHLFTHVAYHQARVAASNLAHPDKPVEMRTRAVPWATFTNPSFGRVGQTEVRARAQLGDDNVAVARYEFSSNERARMEREGRGRIKLVGDRASGQLVGAHIVGPSADELVHICALAIEGQVPVATLADMVYAYPTLSEGIKASARRLHDQM